KGRLYPVGWFCVNTGLTTEASSTNRQRRWSLARQHVPSAAAVRTDVPGSRGTRIIHNPLIFSALCGFLGASSLWLDELLHLGALEHPSISDKSNFPSTELRHDFLYL